MSSRVWGRGKRHYVDMAVTVILAVLVVLGSVTTAWASVDAYRGRTRETAPGSGLYTIPKSSPLGLVLGIAGAVAALVGGLLGLFI